jgi:hypothetical protein
MLIALLLLISCMVIASESVTGRALSGTILRADR